MCKTRKEKKREAFIQHEFLLEEKKKVVYKQLQEANASKAKLSSILPSDQRLTLVLYLILRQNYQNLCLFLSLQGLEDWGIISSYKSGIENIIKAGVSAIAFTARACLLSCLHRVGHH